MCCLCNVFVLCVFAFVCKRIQHAQPKPCLFLFFFCVPKPNSCTLCCQKPLVCIFQIVHHFIGNSNFYPHPGQLRLQVRLHAIDNDLVDLLQFTEEGKDFFVKLTVIGNQNHFICRLHHASLHRHFLEGAIRDAILQADGICAQECLLGTDLRE